MLQGYSKITTMLLWGSSRVVQSFRVFGWVLGFRLSGVLGLLGFSFVFVLKV